jgi:hypothetical protein
MLNTIRIAFTMILVMVALKAGVHTFNVEWNKLDESGLCYNTTIDCEEAEQYENTFEMIFG